MVLSWIYPGVILELSWGYPGVMVGLFWRHAKGAGKKDEERTRMKRRRTWDISMRGSMSLAMRFISQSLRCHVLPIAAMSISS